MELVKAGEVVKTTIIGDVFHVKVMSVYEQADWSEKCTSGNDKNLVVELAKKIVKIEGYDEAPIDVLKKVRKPSDLVKIINGIISASGLSEQELKNSESSLAQPTTISLDDVAKTVDGEKSPVSSTAAPIYE